MKGNRLIPLNRLRSELPEVYESHVKKYEGREKLLEKRIPILDCLWNDVLHFSPINPQIILDIKKQNNLLADEVVGMEFEAYKIPLTKIEEENTVCYQSFNYDFDKFDPSLNKFWEFNLSEYEELVEVPAKQVEIWKMDKQAGRELFWFSHIMHILSKTEVDVSDCEVIKCS